MTGSEDKSLRQRTAAGATPAMIKSGAVPRLEALGLQNDLKRKEERDAVFAVVERHSSAFWGRAVFEVFHTLAFYALLWTYQDSWLATILASFIRVRIFILFHDMAHDSFFPSTKVNQIVGTLLGVFNHTPFSFWRRGHNHHHRHSNNIKYPQYSQTSPWTLEMWNKAKWWQRRLYKFTFAPFGFLCVVPFTLFGFGFRFVSKLHEHVVDFIYLGLVWYFNAWSFEFWSFILAGLPAFTLFHAQHTFPGGKRYPPEEWSFYENGMSGSSFLQVPFWFEYFTANIQYHHIHHLSPLVPLYRLKDCHKAAGKLFDRVPRVTFGDAFRWMTPMVWDTEAKDWVTV